MKFYVLFFLTSCALTACNKEEFFAPASSEIVLLQRTDHFTLLRGSLFNILDTIFPVLISYDEPKLLELINHYDENVWITLLESHTIDTGYTHTQINDVLNVITALYTNYSHEEIWEEMNDLFDDYLTTNGYLAILPTALTLPCFEQYASDVQGLIEALSDCFEDAIGGGVSQFRSCIYAGIGGLAVAYGRWLHCIATHY